MIHDDDRFFSSATKPIEQGLENPATSVGVRSHARRMKNLRGEIAAEDTPRGTVRSRADGVLVTGDDLAGWNRRGPIGEDGAV